MPLTEGIGPWQHFEESLARGKFVYQSCRSCGCAYHRPRVACPKCGGRDYQWRESSGLGTVYAATAVPQRRRKHGDGDATHLVVLVDVDEGFRVMGRASETLPPIGARVRVAASASVTGDDMSLSVRELSDA